MSRPIYLGGGVAQKRPGIIPSLAWRKASNFDQRPLHTYRRPATMSPSSQALCSGGGAVVFEHQWVVHCCDAADGGQMSFVMAVARSVGCADCDRGGHLSFGYPKAVCCIVLVPTLAIRALQSDLQSLRNIQPSHAQLLGPRRHGYYSGLQPPPIDLCAHRKGLQAPFDRSIPVTAPTSATRRCLP